MISSCRRRGFTLVELLVVVAMIGVILSAFTLSVSGAMQRVKIQRATSDVKVISQAILGYENYQRGGDFKLPAMGGNGTGEDITLSSLKIVFGGGGNDDAGNKIPATLMAAVRATGDFRDPWGTCYKVVIREYSGGGANIGSSSVKTGIYFPNMYRSDYEDL